MGSAGFVLTCEMRRAQAFVRSEVGICGSIAQTDSFVFTGVIQTSIRLFTKPPRVVAVAPAMVCAVPVACLANTGARAKSEQRGSLAELRPDGHVEPQAEPAQLRVPIVQGDEVALTRDEPLGLNLLALVYVAGEQELILPPSTHRAAFKVVFRHVEEPDAVRLERFVGGHQQFVSVLQLKRAYLREAERSSGWLLSPWRGPTLGDAPADVSHEGPVHSDRALLNVPLK